MKYTNSMKANGELAVRRMSDKARKYYNETDPLEVYEYEADGATLYTVNEWGEWTEGMTFESLEADFEAGQDAIEEGDDE